MRGEIASAPMRIIFANLRFFAPSNDMGIISYKIREDPRWIFSSTHVIISRSMPPELGKPEISNTLVNPYIT